LDVRHFGGHAFLMTEAPDATLQDMLDQHHLMPYPGVPVEFEISTLVRNGRPMLSRAALPIFIDILRGVTYLDDAGIFHTGFSMDNVILKDSRAIIGDLGSMCYLYDDRDAVLACDVCEEEPSMLEPGWSFTGMSAMMQAPESRCGGATGPAGHAWTAALMYATMRFGYNPAQRAVAERLFDSGARQHDETKEGRETLRLQVYHFFDIKRDPGFAGLGAEEQALLQGMLCIDPAERWTSARGLDAAKRLAAAVGVEVLPPRPAPEAVDAEPAADPDSWA